MINTDSEVSVANVKLSFTIRTPPELCESSTEYLYYQVKHYKILKIKKFTFTFMRAMQFVNLTGCQSLSDIISAIDCFKLVCQIRNVISLKIDTMTLVLRGKSACVEKFPEDVFIKKYHRRFPAITVKHRIRGLAANIFPRTIVIMGAKHVNNAEIFLKYIT